MFFLKPWATVRFLSLLSRRDAHEGICGVQCGFEVTSRAASGKDNVHTNIA